MIYYINRSVIGLSTFGYESINKQNIPHDNYLLYKVIVPYWFVRILYTTGDDSPLLSPGSAVSDAGQQRDETQPTVISELTKDSQHDGLLSTDQQRSYLKVKVSLPTDS